MASDKETKTKAKETTKKVSDEKVIEKKETEKEKVNNKENSNKKEVQTKTDKKETNKEKTSKQEKSSKPETVEKKKEQAKTEKNEKTEDSKKKNIESKKEEKVVEEKTKETKKKEKKKKEVAKIDFEKMKEEAIAEIKPIFKKFNAMSTDKGIIKQELKAELEEAEIPKDNFKYLKKLKIIQKQKGKYYYIEENEKGEAIVIKKTSKKAIALTIVAIAIIIAVALVTFLKTEETIIVTETVTDDAITFEIDNSWTEFTDYYSDYAYYKYITSTPLTDEELASDDLDYSQYPAYLTVACYTVDEDEVDGIEDIQENMKEYVESMTTTPDVYEDEITTTEKGYDVLKIKSITKTTDYYIVEYAYYILNDTNLAIVDTYSFNEKDGNSILKSVEITVNSLEWVE